VVISARRTVLVGALTIVLLAAGMQAARADERTTTLLSMGDYSTPELAARASEVPADLVAALADGPGITAAEYVARSRAAVDAVDVVASLRANNVTVLGSRLDGTDLVVNVSSAADAHIVESAGAIAELGEPPVVAVDTTGAAFAERDLFGGSAYYFENATYGARCSVGFTGYARSSGAPQFATAGHCTAPGLTLGGYYYALTQARASSDWDDYGFAQNRKIGKPVSGSFRLGGGYDSGLVNVQSLSNNETWRSQPAVLSWEGSSTGTPTTAQQITDSTPAMIGAPLCKSGATTGWTCGVIFAVDESVTVQGTVVNSIIASICVLSGDSGGSAVMDGVAIGITSWSNRSTCSSNPSANTAGFFPLASDEPGRASVAKRYGAVWEPAIDVSDPHISGATQVEFGGALTGTLLNGAERHGIRLYVDGSTTPLAGTVSDGEWSAGLTAVLPGAHTAVARGTWGTRSVSGDSAPFSFTVDEAPLGLIADSPTAAAESVALAGASFSGTTPVVYLSTGAQASELYAALAAASASDAPVLLIKRDSLPGVVAAELRRLEPARIIVAGSSSAVSDEVLRELRDYAPSVTRLGAAALVESALTESASVTSAPVTSVSTVSAPMAAPAVAPAAVPGPLNGWQSRFSWALVR
jgi:hypothetical protein